MKLISSSASPPTTSEVRPAASCAGETASSPRGGGLQKIRGWAVPLATWGREMKREIRFGEGEMRVCELMRKAEDE